MIKYSFVLPVYKVEKYLSKCIDSILNQRVTNFEIILIDDGSPDNCPKICDDYAQKDERVKVIHKTNSGVSETRNRGLQEAKGEYVLFVDTDDYVEDDYLEIIDKNISDNDMLVFGYKNVYKNKVTNGFSEENILDKEEAQRYLVEDSKFCGYLWNKVFKNSVIKEKNIQFDPSISMCEDLLFCYQYINNIEKVKLIDYKLINYRQRKSSAISKKVSNIKASSLVKTYAYILSASSDKIVTTKCKSLYLKSFYKYKRYTTNSDFNDDLIKSIISIDYKSFSKKDKKIILMYKYIPIARGIIYKMKDVCFKKFE